MNFTGLDLIRNRKSTFNPLTKITTTDYIKNDETTPSSISELLNQSKQMVICIDDKVFNDQIKEITKTNQNDKLGIISSEAAQFLGTLHALNHKPVTGKPHFFKK